MTQKAQVYPVAGPTTKRDDLWHRIYTYRYIYLMLVPTIVLLLIFNYYPAFMGLYRSFFNWDVGLDATFVGLENFRKLLFEDEVFRQSLVNVGFLTLWHIISGVTIPFMVAELIFNLRSQAAQYSYRVLMILPAVVPGIVTLLLWRF